MKVKCPVCHSDLVLELNSMTMDAVLKYDDRNEGINKSQLAFNFFSNDTETNNKNEINKIIKN